MLFCIWTVRTRAIVCEQVLHWEGSAVDLDAKECEGCGRTLDLLHSNWHSKLPAGLQCHCVNRIVRGAQEQKIIQIMELHGSGPLCR